jgi:hypothetical protein
MKSKQQKHPIIPPISPYLCLVSNYSGDYLHIAMLLKILVVEGGKKLSSGYILLNSLMY